MYQTPNEEENVLEKYGRDLTKNAKEKITDPIIGRDEEIRNLTRILSRKNKNNPVLIGEPGTGKTAIVEGLAQRIIKKDVPEILKGKTIWELDLAAVVAGAKYKGEYEERLKKILNEIEKSKGDIIVFIDEIHMIATSEANGAMDTSNILKPMLARGTIRVIGATTLNEYRKYIEKDGALERRFQKVLVSEPTVSDTITILRGLKERYEIYHGVEIKDKALIAASTLSDRYITDRFLPDKAIDLVDEACASIRMQINSSPIELDNLERKILKLEIEKEALKKEKDEVSIKRIEELDSILNSLKDEEKTLKEKWEEEKVLNEKINTKRKNLENKRYELEKAESLNDFENAAVLKHGVIPKLEEELKELTRKDAERLVPSVVTDDIIAEVVSKYTNIPVSKILSSEKEKLLSLEENLNKKVIGQEKAVKLVSDAIIRSRAGIKDPDRPIGSFLFLGPTGVGKTELALSLAEELFDNRKHVIRIDMSEYMEKFSLSRLIGAPPGYVGYDEGGELTEKVRRNPYSIVLLDEIEKAHPEVLNLLLQIMDAGRCTDSTGRIIDFKNTIIIMTSNLGSEYILNEESDKALELLKGTFKPEFLNRIDDIITFNKLDKKVIDKIFDKIILEIENRLSTSRIKLDVTKEAKKYFIDNGFNEAYGARPLKRFISHKLEVLIAKNLIEGNIKNNQTITIDINGKEIIIK